MKNKEMTAFTLELFDAGASDAGVQAAGETTATDPVSTRQDLSGEENNEAPAPGEQNTYEARKKAFDALVKGEYKDIYTQETQRIINQRFKAFKETESKLTRLLPLVDALKERYGDLEPEALKDAIAQTAEPTVQENGINALHEENERLTRENADLNVARRMEKWQQEAQNTEKIYPDFSLEEELKDENFLRLLHCGLSVQNAYEVLHLETLRGEIAEKKKEEKTRREQRPAENGTVSRSSFTVRQDVSRLSREQRAELARRAAHGETIRFS